MPELPEVECLAQGLRKAVVGASITSVKFWRTSLREPIPTEAISQTLLAKRIVRVERRAKYLLLTTEANDGVIIHLGMSGNLLLTTEAQRLSKHTHVTFQLARAKKRQFLQYVDHRRFGRMSFFRPPVMQHQYLRNLGVEPLTTPRLGNYLWQKSRNKKQAIKSFLMDSKIVVGIGNIYASEILHAAHLNPYREAKDLALQDYQLLARASRQVLQQAIAAGGTTFRDYKDVDGKQGYFAVQLSVYGKQSTPCPHCQTPIVACKISGRSTFYCPTCQNSSAP